MNALDDASVLHVKAWHDTNRFIHSDCSWPLYGRCIGLPHTWTTCHIHWSHHHCT